MARMLSTDNRAWSSAAANEMGHGSIKKRIRSRRQGRCAPSQAPARAVNRGF